MKPVGTDGTEEQPIKAPVFCSQRWNFGTLAFFGLLFIYVVRVNLSVAVICMIDSGTSNVTSNHFPGNISHTSRSLQHGNQTSIPSEQGIGQITGEEEKLSVGQITESCVEDEMQEVSGVLTSGEFHWDKSTRSQLLAMYFYGYIFTQIPGGWLAERYGGRKVWGMCQFVGALCTLLTPVGARLHVYVAYAFRFILGLASGVSFPCVHAMMGRWAPKLERSKLVGFAFAGPPLGTILTFSISALLCSYGFDRGWGSIFYLSGAGNLLWVVAWVLFTADTPSEHKRISIKERDYILHSIGEKPDTQDKIPTPWRAVLTSGPVWAIVCAHACNNFTNYTLLTSLPTFMKEVLKFDIKQNGALSALPYLCQAVLAVVFGQLTDYLRERKILSTKAARKLMQCTSFMGMAACIASAGFLTCDQRGLAVFIICLCLSFMGMNRAGFAVNHLDLAPRHAGVLYGITNTVATVPGMIAPLIVGALTTNKTAEEWRQVFYICSALAVFGAIVFGLLADGELQSWAAPPPVELTFDVTPDKKWSQDFSKENFAFNDFEKEDKNTLDKTEEGSDTKVEESDKRTSS